MSDNKKNCLNCKYRHGEISLINFSKSRWKWWCTRFPDWKRLNDAENHCCGEWEHLCGVKKDG